VFVTCHHVVTLFCSVLTKHVCTLSFGSSLSVTFVEGTVLQAGRAQVRFLMESLEFSIDLILLATVRP